MLNERTLTDDGERIHARTLTQDGEVIILDYDEGEENVNSASRRSTGWVPIKALTGVIC